VNTPQVVSDDRFAIIYRELAISQLESRADTGHVGPELDLAELRAIDELRRFAMEVANPQPSFYTGT
jgi:hypothetical protein